jgi:hypothetical protein
MFELIYCSAAKDGLTSTDISDILKIARDFNKKNNITGCLLYHNNEFIQILEGDKKIVQELYSKIVKDIRNFNVDLIAEGEKTEKSFENWSMAYKEFNKNDLHNLNETIFKSNIIAFSELIDKPTYAVKLFWYMAKQLLTE